MKQLNIIFTTILLAVGILGFCPLAQAGCPSPNPGCPGGNTADGQNALLSLTTGTYNTGVGIYSLLSLTENDFCTAVGAGALLANTGGQNTAVGAGALLNNTASTQNVAVGSFALFQNTGGANTAVGAGALDQNIAGNFNTAIGKDAGALATGSGNVYIGHLVAGVAGEDNHTYIRNIKDTVVNSGNFQFVTVDLDSGLLGHSSSSRRYKEDIKPMDTTSEVLYRLKPVAYRYKKEVGRSHAISFGLIAEDVAEVNPDLVARDVKGQPESVHYEMVNAMLLNEFLKEHKTVQELKMEIARLTSTIKDQAAQIQKVIAQLEVSKPTSRFVLNSP